ncbi:MAG: DUF1349 domain-containing protein [Chloroflexi bacterium]|nr:DUF1349 domain-containing protein [Chloroflexota bacterium]
MSIHPTLTVRRILFLFVALLAASTILACDLASLTGGATTALPTLPPIAQAPTTPGQPTQSSVAQATPPAATKQSISTTQTFGNKKLVSPDQLNSYRMKMTLRAKEDAKTGDMVTTIEAVKNPPAKRMTMGNIEVITIGNQTWTKIAGKWIQQAPSVQQTSAGGISDDVLKQLEENYTLQEVGKETVNGISCKRYTFKGESTVSAQAGFQGEITIRAQGEAWVADQAGLPPVAIRQRGDLEMQSNVAPNAARPTAVTIKFTFEAELYDINTPITITPPTGAQLVPTSPAKPTSATKPTAVRSPTPNASAPTSVLQPTLSAGTQLFADEFNSATLDAKWTWEDRWQDAKYDLKARPGFIRITAPSGNDLWTTSNFDAPYLVQPIDGNFMVETLVEFAPTEGFQGAGILVYQDDDNLVRLERAFGGTGGDEGGIHFSVIRAGEAETVAGYGDAPTTAKRIELRVQRVGNQFSAWWREPGKTWLSIGTTQVQMSGPVQVGIAVLAEWGAGDSVADFDSVRISRPK